MSISLTKKQKLSLTKKTGGRLKSVFMGLGWDPVGSGVGGFISNLFGLGGGGEDIDLDASCLMFDKSGGLIDTVWFRKLSSSNGCVRHTGDNLTGGGDGDDEVINVDLISMPSSVETLVFVITSFRGQTFDQIENAFCRLVDRDTGDELAKYSLSDKGKHTAQIMAKVFRDGDGWSMEAIGEPTQGTVQTQLMSAIAKFL